jgi:hypothetical protein
MRPNASITLSNGNLGGQGTSQTGVSAVVISCAVAPVAGFGVAFLVRSIAQVKTAFAQVGNEAVIEALEKGFYAEAPEGTKLFIVAVVNTNSLTDMAVEAIAGKALQMGAGEVRLVGMIKFPAGSYVATISNSFDADVHTAVTAMQTLANTYLGLKKPFRALIQGYGYTSPANNATDYSVATAAGTKPNVGVVVGQIDNSTARATMLALGKASKLPSQRNIGRVKSGSLNIPSTAVVKIGSATVETMSSVDLDTLHDKHYITFEINETAPGYVFNNDWMCAAESNDYSRLARGRVIDNAVRIAFKAYYEELKDDVDVDSQGRLDLVVEKALEAKIESAIDKDMRAELSKKSNGSAAVECLINPDPSAYAFLYTQNGIDSPNFNILTNGGKVYLFLRARPKGSLSYINVYLGYVATSN